MQVTTFQLITILFKQGGTTILISHLDFVLVPDSSFLLI